MIGKLRGVVDTIGESAVILDVGGVGYEVSCPARLLRQLTPGEPLTLAIETHVREDAIRLFGFPDEAERQWFRLLQNVQGVGTKVALGVLGTLTIAELASAIALQDKAAITRTQGVGPKVAQRILGELKDKAPGLAVALEQRAGAGGAAGEAAGPVEGLAAAEAVSALQNLGYQPGQASAAVAAAMKALGENADTAALIRAGLKELAS
ncbi:MAG: Holliday junction branch migration protein RuvA [Pseudomonadota bacterium]